MKLNQTPDVPLTLRDLSNRTLPPALQAWATQPLWTWIAQAPLYVREALRAIDSPQDYVIAGDVAVHNSSHVESGATLKGPLVVGPGCFIAAGAYLRGGNWLEADVVIGPGVELKSSFVFADTHIAHFNFVGDSVIGAGVNFEAGSIVCNHRNEREDKHIRVRWREQWLATETTKLGALIGDRCRIGANAVLSPGTVLEPGQVVTRLQLVEQDPE